MKTLKINLLYQCTAKCAHCRFGCENESVPKKPNFDTPFSVAKTLKENFGLDIAVILGGEPTLFPDGTAKLIENISNLDVKTRLETNASFADTYESAYAFLSGLKKYDTQVMLSLDGFHDPFVPEYKIANAIRACNHLGLRFNLEMPYLDIEHKNNEIDRKTDELFAKLKSEIDTNIPVYQGGMIFTGRAAETFGDAFAKGRGVPLEKCACVPWWSHGDIKSLDLLIYEPGGYITKGCGIAIGNVFETDLAEMLKNYSAENNPVFRILINEGPIGLARLAEKYGYHTKQDYADKCHLCYEARKVLKPYYDQILKPDQHYKITR